MPMHSYAYLQSTDIIQALMKCLSCLDNIINNNAMKLFLITVVFCYLLGTLEAYAYSPDIDINRIRLSEDENKGHNRRSILPYQHSRTNDYEDISSWMLMRHDVVNEKDNVARSPIKIHQPREDPKLFYQSDSYIQEMNKKNANNEVTFVYPGREVVRANEGENPRIPAQLIRDNSYQKKGKHICVPCPRDRTVIAKPGSKRVILQTPRLTSCNGRKAPKAVRFVPKYGPRFGSLIEKGSHVIVGRIMYRNEMVRMCKLQVHVITQEECQTPNYLLSNCNDKTKLCNFTCRDSKMELYGSKSLICGDNMKWAGYLPSCRARSSCLPPSPPDQGYMSCNGGTVAGGHMVEGSKCRLRCDHGWRSSPRAVIACRRGNWTHALTCQLKKAQ